MICKYVTLYDLFQNQVNASTLALEELSQSAGLFEKAEEFAKGGVDGAKKLGGEAIKFGNSAKNQLRKPIDMLTVEKSTGPSSRRAEIGKST